MSTHKFGILGVGDSEVAFEVSSLREVVSLTQPPAPMPRVADWLVGSFALRGAQIPVVDLARMLGLRREPAPVEHGHTVAVLAGRGRRFGVVVDRVEDVVTLDESQVSAIDQENDAIELFANRVFCRSGTDSPVYVLDIDAMLDIKGMVHVGDEAGRGARAARTGWYARGAARQRAVIASSGALTLAIDADVVREIADCHTLIEPALALPGYLGNHRLREDIVPVFDARVLLGQAPSVSRLEQMVVLDTGQGNLALAVEHIMSMVEYQPQDCLALAGPSDQSTDTGVAGLLSRPDMADALLVSHTALFAREELANIARVHAELNADTKQRERSGVVWRRFAFLHFQAGGQFVVFMDQLDAVLTMPEHYAPLGGSGVFEGVFRHLDELVTLVDLRRLIGDKAPARAASQVLVVAAPAGRIGFMVDLASDIEYIEAPADSLHVHRYGVNKPNPTLAERQYRLTSVGDGERKQFLSLFCLESLAAQLLGDAAPAQGRVCGESSARYQAIA